MIEAAVEAEAVAMVAPEVAAREAGKDLIEATGSQIEANTGATEEANIDRIEKIEEANTGVKDRIEIIEITEVIDRVTSEVTVLPEETEDLVVADGEAAVALLAADPGAAVADIENNKLPDFLQSCDAAEITVV